jgi:hypothetical protein
VTVERSDIEGQGELFHERIPRLAHWRSRPSHANAS